MNKTLSSDVRKMQYRKFRRRRRMLKGIAVLFVTLLIVLVAVRLPLGGEDAIAASVTQATELSVSRTLQMEPLYVASGGTLISRIDEPITESAPLTPPEPLPSVLGNVPQSAAVANSYFDNAVFIGNSQMVGFANSTELAGTYYCSVGLNVSTFFKSEVVRVDGENVTIPQAMQGQHFEKAYLLFGVNEFGWSSVEVFTQKYEQIIALLRQNNPDIVIYVESVLPVNESLARENGYGAHVNNQNVIRFNQALSQMFQRQGVYYLDVHSVFADATGAMPAASSSDGLHVNRSCIAKWTEYLKTHTGV